MPERLMTEGHHDDDVEVQRTRIEPTAVEVRPVFMFRQ